METRPSSEQSHPEKLLQQFTDNKLNMSHQKTEIPLGRQRDPNDQMALVKSRLVLDTILCKTGSLTQRSRTDG